MKTFDLTNNGSILRVHIPAIWRLVAKLPQQQPKFRSTVKPDALRR